VSEEGAGPRRRVVVVGAAGKQGQEYLRLLPRDLVLAGVVDSDAGVRRIGARHVVPSLHSVDAAVDRLDFDVAVVAVPHHAHVEVASTLLGAGKHVIKEKPLAVTAADAHRLVDLARRHEVTLCTTVQRSYRRALRHARAQLPRIGAPYWFAYDHHAALPAPTSGWRSSGAAAGGGVLLDMGYHAVDVVRAFFGRPRSVGASFAYCYDAMREQCLEDLANVTLTYPDGRLTGSVTVSRHHYRKHERFEVLGSAGGLLVEPERVVRFARDGTVVDALDVRAEPVADVARMLADYTRRLDDPAFREAHMRAHLDTVAIIEAAYGLTPRRAGPAG